MRLATLAAAVAVVAWLFRYDVQAFGGERMGAYVLDRWTGKLYLVISNRLVGEVTP